MGGLTYIGGVAMWFSKGKRKYTTVLWGYMLLVVAILLLISIFVCNYFYESSRQKTIEKNLLSIKLLKKEIDSQIAYMEDTTQGLKEDYELLLAIMENDGYSDYKLATKLANYTTVNPDIVDIVIFDFRQNKAYCSSGTIEAEKYFDFYARSTIDARELSRQISLTEDTTLKGFFQVEMHKDSDIRDVALYITPVSSTRKLVYIIRKDIFYKPVETVIGNLKGTFCLLDPSHTPVLSFNINTDTALVPDFHDYSEEGTSEGISMGNCGSNMVVSSNSAVSRFQYCIVSGLPLSSREFHAMQSVLLASLIGLLIIGLTSSYIFANMSYKPIVRLKSFIMNQPESEATTGCDDLDDIKDHLYEIQEKLRATSQRLLSDKDFLWNSLINALVSSTSVYYTNHERYLQEGILFSCEVFAVLVAEPSDKNAFCQFHHWEDDKGGSICYVSDKNEYGLLIALFNAENDSLLEWAEEEFCKAVLQRDVSCRIGIGNNVKGTHQIRQSFLQALTALNAAGDDNPVSRYDPNIQNVIHQLDCLNVLKPKLAHAIRQCNMGEVEGLIREVFQSTTEYTQHILIYSDLISQLILIAYSVNFYDDEMNDALYYIYSDRQSMINGYLIFAGRLCDRFEKMQRSQSTQLLLEIQAYISKNYADKNLSVQGISDHFNVSVSYLNKYMKEVGSDTAFSILDKVRMEHAKKMLLGGNAPLKDIVDHCGYGDINHFIKKFKKQTGLTPTQFRTGNVSNGITLPDASGIT